MPEVRGRRWPRPGEILGVEQRWLGFVDSGLPEGDPLPPLPEGCFALQPLEGRRAAGRAGPRVPAARDHDLRRERRLPAPGPHHDPQGRVEAFEAAGGPERYPEAGEPWQPLKLYYNLGFPRAADRRGAQGDAGPGPGVALRGVARAAGSETERADGTITTQVPCARLLRDPRRGAARARHPDRPRRRFCSPSRWTSSARSGRPRSTSWPGRWWTPTSRGRPVRGHPRRIDDMRPNTSNAGPGKKSPLAAKDLDENKVLQASLIVPRLRGDRASRCGC